MTENKNRCVITGLGLISAIGSSVDECWNNAINSVSGIKETTTVETENCYAKLAAEVSDNCINEIEEAKDFDRVSKLAIKAASEALSDANLSDFNNSPRVSVIMGSCVGGSVSTENYYKNGKSASDVLKMPISIIASQVAGYCHAGGVVTNIANACAAGTISISYACDLIRSGKADIVIAGGADAFASIPYSGFLALHALDSNPCSPFNHCTGITLGEGSGVVIVESYEHAKARNAKMYCEVLGSGVSSDAHHITAPRPDGEGQMNAIRRAISTSGVDASEIGYINAHGTGTAKNDNAEFLSLHTIFDDVNSNLSVSSTKAMVGHCLGAAGAIEAVFSIKALTENKMPATLGYSSEDLEALKEKAGQIDFIPNNAKEKELTHVMNNSFAFGGNNASIIFSKTSGDVKEFNKKEVAITGIGTVNHFGNSVEKYIEQANSNAKVEASTLSSNVSIDDYKELGYASGFFRKLDNFSKLQAVSGLYALKNGGLQVTDENATQIGIVVGTSEGALGTCCLFEENIAEKGNANGSAFNFPNTVYNAAGGYLSIASGIKGYNVTITNGSQSGLASVCYASNIINKSDATYVLATGTDENIEVIKELYSKLDLVSDSVVMPYDKTNKFTLSDGSTSILVEDLANAQSRGAHVYARVTGCGMSHKNVSFGHISGSSDALVNAINEALNDANLTINDIDMVSGLANGHASVDNIEEVALKEVFGENYANLPIVNVKALVGEARSNAASLACAHAALIIDGKVDKNNYVYNHKVEKDVNNILVIAYGSGGSYTAVVLSK